MIENYKEIQFKKPNDIKEYLSISQVLALIQEPFDSEGVAKKTYDKHHDNPNSEYYNMSVFDIMQKWAAKGAESCRYGSLLDNYIGMILNNADETDIELFKLDYENDERLNGLVSSFDSFVEEVLKTHKNLEFVNREQTLYYKINEGQYIKGRFDALFYNKDNGHYVIVDWKSSGSVDKKPTPWTGKLLGPAKDLLALNYNTYTIQVYFYKTALEQMGYIPEGSIVDCIIVQLPGHIISENNKNYCVHNPAFAYNKKLLDDIFTYSFKKQMILEKKSKTNNE